MVQNLSKIRVQNRRDHHNMLERVLELKDLVAIGIGSVIGSGIFILFRTILELARSSTCTALFLAAIPNILTALAYAELSGIYQRNDVEYVSVKDAFGSDTIATITTYILLIFMIFNSATVILFIGSLLQNYIQFDKFLMTLVLLFSLSVINYIGITVSKSITNIVGVIEVTALLLIGLLAMLHLNTSSFTFVPTTKKQTNAFWMASFLALFLYSGYDSLVKLSEETKDPGKNIPTSIIITICIVTLIYILMGAAATSIGVKTNTHISPIQQLYEKIIHKKSAWLMMLLGMVIVMNTAFIGVISMSRFIYGLAQDGKLPSIFQETNKRYKTPHNAVIAVFISMAFALLIHYPEKCASLANIFFLVFMMIMMVCVILLRIQQKGSNSMGTLHYQDKTSSTYRIPLSVLDIPVFMVIGIVSCFAYLVFGIMNFRHL